MSAPLRYVLSRWLWLRLLALVYLIAFLSLWTQVHGLFGSQGISSLQELFLGLSQRDDLGFFDLPSVFWWSASDPMLDAVCLLGVVLSLLALAGIFAPGAFLFLWFFYLSFASVGGVFLGYQWDALLLEAGFLAIFTAPFRLLSRPSQEREPPRIVLLLWWVLIFKLMFLSGVVKLASGDETWRDFTALQYHYVTQPLPSWTSYYVYQLPMAFHYAATLATFVIELIFPFFLFGPRVLRAISAASFILLQVMISLTGSYGFFGLLTIALCVPLLDDGMLTRLTPKGLRKHLPQGEVASSSQLTVALLSGLAVFLFLLSAFQMLGTSLGRQALPEGAKALLEATAPFESVNAYGLFAVMTTARDEIELEGSYDGKEWRAYEFSWKPDLLDEAPHSAAPHQPRLDWQMWFAALGTCRKNQWFLQLQKRLLEGSPSVEALFAKNPFPERPPVYLRSTLYQYEFTSLGESDYWKRAMIEPYCPALTLTQNKLEPVPGLNLAE